MSQQAQNDYYDDPERLAVAYADSGERRVRDLFAAGADIVQLDEPYLQARPEPARAFGLRALDRALEGGDRHDRRTSVLRVRRDHPRTAVGILVPARTGRLRL